MIFLNYFFTISVISFLILQFYGKIDADDKKSYTKPGPEFLLYSTLMAWACMMTDFQYEWFNVLISIYAVTCAETDKKEQFIFRIGHYPIILLSIIMLILYPVFPHGVWFMWDVSPVMYVIILLFAQILHAYKSGDTWMFATCGLYLYVNHVWDTGLLTFWFIALFLFILSNITSLRFVENSETKKKTLVLAQPKPIGPFILLSLAINMVFHLV